MRPAKTHQGAAPRIFTPEYYERMRDLEDGSWWNAAMRDVEAELLGLARLPKRGRVLDVGFGSGQGLLWFSSLYPDWQTLGLDIALDGLAAARKFGLTRVMRASAVMLPVQSAAIDLVLALDVLQHLPLAGGDLQALREVRHALRPDGYLLLRTNAQTFPRAEDDPEFQFHKYQVSELRQKLTQSGFDIIRIGRLNAVLGLAEIPRELCAGAQPHSYHGLLSEPPRKGGWLWNAKRRWLRTEGRAICLGASLPLGRTILALCRRRP